MHAKSTDFTYVWYITLTLAGIKSQSRQSVKISCQVIIRPEYNIHSPFSFQYQFNYDYKYENSSKSLNFTSIYRKLSFLQLVANVFFIRLNIVRAVSEDFSIFFILFIRLNRTRIFSDLFPGVLVSGIGSFCLSSLSFISALANGDCRDEKNTNQNVKEITKLVLNNNILSIHA